MSQRWIQVSEEAGVVRILLNRPDKRNALTRELLVELRESLQQAASRNDLRLLVLGSVGPAFCAGMDLAQMQETASHPDAEAIWQKDTALYLNVVRALFDYPMPTLAVVPGSALAGGLGLVLACDLVLSSDSAKFALPEPKRGITAAIVTPLLVYRVGPSASSHLLLSGEMIDAQRALRIGLAHVVVPADQLEAEEGRFIQSILTGAPEALAVTKRQLRHCMTSALHAQLEQAAVVSAEARRTSEAREGLQAFLEKRAPNWAVAGGDSGEVKAESGKQKPEGS